MGSMSIVHWLIVVIVVVLLFGRNKISGLMGDVAQGIKSFKKGMEEDEPAAVKSERDVKPEQDQPGHRIAAAMLAAPASSKLPDKA